MKTRIFTGLAMIVVIVSIVFFAPVLFTPLVAVILGIATWEWCRIGQIKRPQNYAVAAVTITLWVASSFSSSLLMVLLVLTALHYIYALYLIISYEKKADYRISTIHLSISGPIVLATLASSLMYLFNQTDGVSQLDDAMSLTFIIMVIAGADTGAYFAGRFWGKHQLSPRTSPKKTVEGLLGGLALTTLMVVLFGFMVSGWYLSFWQLWLIGIIAALFSVVGDLFISIIKRQNHIKDASNILPGHGGILDRIDGLLAGIPVFYLLQQYL